MIDLSTHRDALSERIRVIKSLVDETHPTPPAVGPIAREARGLAVVLLFAAYEELITSATRTLLETAASLRVSNRRLKPGLRAFAINNAAKSLRAVSEKKVFVSALPTLIEVAARGGRTTTIDVDAFPTDGSFMKRSQIQLWADLFDLDPPARILHRTWHKIDTIVVQRNGVAHGRLTPQEVGRSYTESEIRDLIDDWFADWDGFLVRLEKLASRRDFYRLPR